MRAKNAPSMPESIIASIRFHPRFQLFKRCFLISIRAPAGGVTQLSTFISTIFTFQPTLSQGKRLTFSHTSSSVTLFQSTPPQRERQCIHNDHPYNDTISIRAPAWGATECSSALIWAMLISIRAPTRGATRIYQRLNQTRHISIRAPVQ